MWFLAKIRHKEQDIKGKWKTTAEQFLHEAITYGEVEQQLATLAENRLRNGYEYDINKISFDAIYEPHVKGAFFKVTIEEWTPDKHGVDKMTLKLHYVIAEDVPSAEAKAQEYVKNWITDVTVVGADKTKILAVWNPKNQAWQDDYRSRMADYSFERKEAKLKKKPSSIFNEDGSAKVPESEKGQENSAVNVDELDEVAKANGYKMTREGKNKKIVFHKQNGDVIDS